ncbi:MAG: GNAT family N-acetyltransferase [Anaerocolumna sp.]
MKVINYEGVGNFLRENESILLEKESVSQLILFNAMNNINSETNGSLFFGKVADDNQDPLLIFANVQPYNLLIHWINGYVKSEAVAMLADYILQNNLEINGLNANKEICGYFTEHYKTLKPQCEFKERLAMDIMELKSLSAVKLVEGISRKAKEIEAGQIARWMVEFAKEALEEDIVYEDQIQKAAKMIETDRLYVFENPEGRLVSMAAASRQLINGICVNYVYTPSEFRSKGYAAANMYHLSKEMLEKGNQFCTLFVDKKNPISNSVYKKIGYRIIEDQYDLRLIR